MESGWAVCDSIAKGDPKLIMLDLACYTINYAWNPNRIRYLLPTLLLILMEAIY